MNEKKTPRIRFKGFTDDWEQRKLGELYTERNERGNRSLQILSVSIHTGVSDGELDVDNLGKFIRRSEDKSTYKHVHSGDLIFNMMRAWQGAIGVAKTEGMISPAYISAIPSEDIYPPFMNYLLRRKNVINQINNLSYGVTDFRKRLYWNSFVQVNCKLPSVEEQRNITDVFEKIDNLITLHQRKYEKLQIIKKSMLENCFPKNGEKVPKIRFSGFARDWEQRKLGDLYTERNERGNGSLQILSVSIHTGVSDGELDVDNLGKFIRRSEDKSTYKHVHSGDLIFNMMRAWQGAIGVAKTEGMISPAYISAIPSEDIYPPFMNYLLRRKNVINQINNLSYGVTDFRKRLYWNSFVQVNCKLPSVEEQRNITDVFEKIDHLITLHQSELEKLQKIKKSLLERMFV